MTPADLEPRAWRALAAMGLAVVVVAVMGAVYLRPWQRAAAQAPAPAPRPTIQFTTAVQEEQFLSPELGWVATGGRSSGALYRTTDGGRHWQRQLHGVNGPVGALRFFDARRGVVYAAGPSGPALWRTRDGGQHWARAAMPGLVPPPLFYFVDADHGWCLAPSTGQGPFSPFVDHQEVTLFRTADGGTTWTQVLATSDRQPVSGGLGDEGRKTWIWFRDRSAGWIGQTTPGEHVVVYATTDGGDHWTRQELPALGGGQGTAGTTLSPPVATGRDGAALVASRIVPAGSGWAVQGESLFTWQPAAAAWSGPVGLPEGAFSTRNFAALDDRRWWVGAGTEVQLTDDAGDHWRLAGAAPPGYFFIGLSLVDAGHAWALVINPRTCTESQPCLPTLARTADGGRHWALVRPPP